MFHIFDMVKMYTVQKRDFIHTWNKCSQRVIKTFVRKKLVSFGVPFSAISTGSAHMCMLVHRVHL